MAQDQCFSNALPPLGQTFHEGNHTCLFLAMAQHVETNVPDSPSTPKECPHRRYCQGAAVSLQRLAQPQVYGPVQVTLTEPSSSIVVRSEHQYNKQARQRLSLRKHFYELSPGSPATSQTLHSFRVTEGAHLALEELGRDLPSEEKENHKAVLTAIRSLEGKEFKNLSDYRAAARNATLENGMDEEELDGYSPFIDLAVSSAFRCQQISPGDSYGEYLGFVDLRRYSVQSPLAMGLLVPPKRYRINPGASVIVGNYGPFFGAWPFACSPYVMHDPETGGSTCAEACLIMAMTFLSDRKALIKGSHTLTYLAKKDSAECRERPEAGAECLWAEKTYPPEGSFPVDAGLDPQECASILQKESHLRVSAYLFCGKHRSDEAYDRLISRVIQCYIHVRFPVIFFVDTEKWWGEVKPESGHAVVVVGTRRTGPGPDDISFIVHDPGDVPFMERTQEECLAAGYRFYSDTATRTWDYPVIQAIFAADHKVTRHFLECIHELEEHGATRLGAHDALWNLVQDKKDYRIFLLDRDVIPEVVLPTESILSGTGASAGERSRMLAILSGNQRETSRSGELFPPARYWCIAFYEGKTLVSLWLFGAETTAGRKYVRYAEIVPDGLYGFKCDDPKFGIAPAKRGAKPTKQTASSTHVSASAEVQAGHPPKATGQPTKGASTPLTPSVMTSSSILSLPALAAELRVVQGHSHFDLFLLRDIDLEELERRKSVSLQSFRRPNANPWESPDLTSILANKEVFEQVRSWLIETCKKLKKGDPQFSVKALATYFPDITSLVPKRREESINALVHSCLLAIDMKEEGILEAPIIEIVCGNLLDPCDCDRCSGRSEDKRRTFFSTPDSKRKLLLDTLALVVKEVYTHHTSRVPEFVIALELEPGETYVLNGMKVINQLFEDIETNNRPKLGSHIGLNLDIAHMRIAGVDAEELQRHSERIVHAHIADHPGMHTRDQPVGTWTPIHVDDEGFYPYLRLMSQRDKESAFPSSNAFALELEGCGRMSWIHRSLNAMRYLANRVWVRDVG